MRVRFSVLIVLLALASACNGGSDAEPDPFAEVPAVDGAEFIEVGPPDHVAGDLEYDLAPPAGGHHNSIWQTCKAYDEPIRDENAVHSLEHGAVWIAYDPNLPDDDAEALRELGGAKVLVAPYPGLDAAVVATAWGVQLRLDDPRDQRIEEFIDAYVDQSQLPETGVTCQQGTTATVDAAPED